MGVQELELPWDKVLSRLIYVTGHWLQCTSTQQEDIRRHGRAQPLFHVEMLSFRGRAGAGALMVDSWLGSTAALVWVRYVLGLTPATSGAEAVERIGQFFWCSVSQVFEEPLEVGVSALSEVL